MKTNLRCGYVRYVEIIIKKEENRKENLVRGKVLWIRKIHEWNEIYNCIRGDTTNLSLLV